MLINAVLRAPVEDTLNNSDIISIVICMSIDARVGLDRRRVMILNRLL